MNEKVFNLFYFSDQDFVKELGAVMHEFDGNDDEKGLFLLSSLDRDLKMCQHFQLPANFTPLRQDMYHALCRTGRHLEVFEEIFTLFGAVNEPYCCITPVVNGSPRVDVSTDNGPLTYGKFQGHSKIGPGMMSDYLEEYMTPAGFDLPRLINDDYFESIRILFNCKRYVSCMKLVVSFIDTIAFIEYGDVQGSYEKWLNSYADLSSLNITGSQLWELRNSVLHMSNLDSRKILAGKEKRICFFVGPKDYVVPPSETMQFFSIIGLINVLSVAISQWIKSINADRGKWVTFVQRYDKIISDQRQAVVKIPDNAF